MKINKTQIVTYLKKFQNIIGDIEINNNSFTINIKGEFVEKMAKKISLKSIYDLVISLQENIIVYQDNTNKRFDAIEQDNKEIKERLTLIEIDNKEIKNKLSKIEKDLNEIKELPTIANELKNKNLSK